MSGDYYLLIENCTDVPPPVSQVNNFVAAPKSTPSLQSVDDIDSQRLDVTRRFEHLRLRSSLF